MANRHENQIGIKAESTYGTAVTVDRFYPYIDGTDGQWDTRQRFGEGIFVGTRRVGRADRMVLPKGQGEITVKVELASRQAGLLLEAALGVSTVTAITGGSQMNFTSSIPNTTMPKSYTIQLGKVRNDGTVDPETYSGCTAVEFEIEMPEDGIGTIEVKFDALNFSTAPALATASYTAGAYLFDHSYGAAGVGGTLVAPTTTTLASGLTAYSNIRSWKFSAEQDADIDRRVLGTRNQPTVGMMEPELEMEIEYNDLVHRTAYLAGTSLPVTLTHTTPEVLGAGFSQLQLAIPALFLDGDVMPPMTDETSTLTVQGMIKFTPGFDPFYLCMRTADTAL